MQARLRIVTLQVMFALTTVSVVTDSSSECMTLQRVFPSCGCSTEVSQNPTVDCSSRAFNSVPVPNGSYTGSIAELKLNNNSITSLGSNILPSLNIRKVDFTNNAIGSVNNYTFQSLGSNLVSLALNGNNNTGLPVNSFGYLKRLEELTLKDYYLSVVEDNSTFFISVTNVKHLTLDNWKLESISQEAFKGLSLLSLSILNQPMVTMPVDLLHSPNMADLQNLRISYANINIVRNYTFSQLHKIQEIDLSNNHIDKLEIDCFSGIGKTLISLSLSNNIFTGANGQFLSLKDLSNLEKLNLSSNSIETVPSSFLSQLNIRKPFSLDLSFNKINSIDTNAFAGANTLKVLYLSHSGTSQPLFDLPSSLTQAAETLKELYLDGRRCNESSLWSVVSQLYALEVLDLSNAQLSYIPNNTFLKLKVLVSLDLSNNNLNRITQESLVGPRYKLKYLSLIGNRISTIPSCIFYQYTSFPITMTLGQITCDCAVVWLWNKIKDKNISFIPGQEAKCSDGQSLASKALKDFCSTPYTEPACLEIYTPTVQNVVTQQINSDSVKISWSLSDTSLVRNISVEVSNVYRIEAVFSMTVPPKSNQVTATIPSPNLDHRICVTAIYESFKSAASCTDLKGFSPNTSSKPPEERNGLSEDEIGIIVGAVIGGVVLFAILGAIVYLIVFRRRPKKEVPSSVPVQPRNFAKSELPTMNEETRTFAKRRGTNAPEHREGMQVVAISDGQTGNIRVGRAQVLHSNGSVKTTRNSRPSNTSNHSSQDPYENDHGALPPTPSKQPPFHPSAYYNQGFRGDSYDEIPHGKESTL